MMDRHVFWTDMVLSGDHVIGPLKVLLHVFLGGSWGAPHVTPGGCSRPRFPVMPMFPVAEAASVQRETLITWIPKAVCWVFGARRVKFWRHFRLSANCRRGISDSQQIVGVAFQTLSKL